MTTATTATENTSVNETVADREPVNDGAPPALDEKARALVASGVDPDTMHYILYREQGGKLDNLSGRQKYELLDMDSVRRSLPDAGLYRIVLYADGRRGIQGKFTFWNEGENEKPRQERSAATAASLQPAPMAGLGANITEKALEAMVVKMLNPPPIMETIAAAVTAATPILKLVFDARQQRTPASEVAELMRLTREMAPEHVGGDGGDGITQAALAILPRLLEGMASPAPAPTAARIVPPRQITEEPAAREPAPISADERNATVAMLAVLRAGAATDGDPDAYAEVLADMTGREAFHQTMSGMESGQLVAALLTMAPDLEESRPWLEQVEAACFELHGESLAPEAAGDDDKGGEEEIACT